MRLRLFSRLLSFSYLIYEPQGNIGSAIMGHFVQRDHCAGPKQAWTCVSSTCVEQRTLDLPVASRRMREESLRYADLCPSVTTIAQSTAYKVPVVDIKSESGVSVELECSMSCCNEQSRPAILSETCKNSQWHHCIIFSVFL
jgi:hypothetical protein